MPTLYNCKHSGNQFRITKFTSDFEVEASYLLDATTCECPAGHRPSCRHRSMLPKFIARNAIDTNWFFDHDRGGWVQGWKEEPEELTAEDIEALPDGLEKDYQQEMQASLDAETLQAHAHIDEHGEGNPPASAALPIQPEPETSPILGGFPDWCLSSGECTMPNDCILNGCAHGHGTPPRSLAPAELGQASDPRPSPPPTIRRRV